ncbi:hypothetical protein ACE6H2_013354 [Prunus campanulata]
MHVQIIETTLIVPSTPPFNDDHVLSLSHLDNDPNLRVSFRYVRAYHNTNPSAPSSNPRHVISAALSTALVHYYPLAATLSLRPDHRFELFCSNGQGVPLIFASSDATLDSVSYLDDPAADFVEQDPPRIGAPVLHECLSLDRGFSPYGQAKIVGPVARECFDVRDECLERFKSELLEQSGLSFTTFEALGAFIWHAKIKALRLPSNEKVTFAYSINVRKLVNPPLPAGHWGNGCVAMYVKLSAKDLTEKPIWAVAEQIKKSKSNTTDEYVRSFIDFQELHYEEGITAGKEVSGFTDWRHLRHSTVDFGWGGPVTVLPLSRNLLGSVEPCFFLPPSSSAREGKKDGFRVLVNLRESAMPAFREEMEKFSCPEFGLP